MNHRANAVLTLVLLCALPLHGHAMEYEGFGDAGLAWNASSLGFGAELMVPTPKTRWLPQNMQVRVGANGFQYTLSTVKSDVDYDITFKLLNAHAYLDWYPWENGFRFTIGVFYNGNRTDILARARAGGYNFNGNNYAVGVGTVDGDITVNKVAPYLGVGLDHRLSRDGRWSLSLDVGAFYHGTPKASLNANCANPVTCPAFRQDVEEEENALNRDLKKLIFYPVLTAGTVYRF